MGGTAMALAACTATDDATQHPADEEAVVRQVTMRICLQPDMDMTTGGTPLTRAKGDPGTYEHFDFPRYFYVYAVGFTDEGGAYPESAGGTVCPVVLDGPTEVNRIDVGTKDWEKYNMYVDPPQTLNDSVYGSKQNVTFKVPSNSITKLRFYVAASPVPLKHDGHELGVGDQVLKSGHNESHVLGLRFDVDNDLISAGLHNVYSSPYNYAPAGSPYNGEYYYTINDPTTTGDITRIIYHVAAKVDVIWNVAKERQSSVRITHVEARKLKQRDCLLFKPTENTWTTSGDNNDEANNYSMPLMQDDVGRQWYGREYFYTIPYRDNFYVHLHLRKNGDDDDAVGYNLRLKKDLTPAAYSIFTPWLRTDLRFTGPFNYNATETEIVIP